MLLPLIFQVDVPVHDQWDLVPAMSSWCDGRLPVNEIWHPYGEHRMFLPRLLMLLMGRASGWRIQLESLLSSLLLISVAALIAISVVRESRKWKRNIWIPLAIISLMTLAPNRAEAYMWGWQLQVSLALFLTISALILFEKSQNRLILLIPALICGFAASISFGAGLAVWPSGLLILLPLRSKRSWIRAAVWFATAAGVASVYLGSMHETSGPITLEDLPGIAFYATVFLGAPLLTYAHRLTVAGIYLTGVIGSAGTVLLAFLVSGIRRSGGGNWRFWGALGCISIFAGLLAGAGRSGLGAEQALALRYIPFSSLLWISIVALMTTVKNPPFTVRLRKTVLWILVLMVLFSSVHGIYYCRRRMEWLEPVPQMLLDGRYDLAAPRVLIEQRKLQHLCELLRYNRLSVYR